MRLSDFAGAAGIAALLAMPLALYELLGNVDDRSAEAFEARRAFAADLDERRREAAAYAICAEFLGPNSAPVWQADGSMRCANKRGHVIKTLSHFPERRL